MLCVKLSEKTGYCVSKLYIKFSFLAGEKYTKVLMFGLSLSSTFMGDFCFIYNFLGFFPQNIYSGPVTVALWSLWVTGSRTP